MQKLHKGSVTGFEEQCILKLNDIHDEKYTRLIKRLRGARLEAGLTQEEVANLLGKPQYFVSRSETGERRIDAIELQAFASIYKKPISYFLNDITED